MPELFSCTLRSTRDLLQVRRRIRQLCKLLHFDELEQSKITCVLFEVLCDKLQEYRKVFLFVELFESSLDWYVVQKRAKEDSFSDTRESPVFTIPMRMDQNHFPEEDLRWVMQAMDLASPSPLLEELRSHNQYFLQMFLELEKYRKKAEKSPPSPSRTSAA